MTKQSRQTALITGAARGIGRACAIAFAAEGYDLYLTCHHSREALLSLSGELEAAYGITCHAATCDAASYEETARLFSRIERLDLLINNAGISHIGLLQEMEPAQWDTLLRTNLSSCFYTAKCAIPMMLRQGYGRIINISSVWGSVGASMEVAYSAAKGGVNAFTKALAKELAPSHIQVNAAAFGVIDTDMNCCFSDSERLALIEEIPASRMGSAKEAAALVLQLAKAPAYLTGQILTMDGGWC